MVCPYTLLSVHTIHTSRANKQVIFLRLIFLMKLRKLLYASLPSSALVGSSGISLRNMSSFNLKFSTFSEVILLRFAGKRLNMRAPFTDKLFSLALRTETCNYSSLHLEPSYGIEPGFCKLWVEEYPLRYTGNFMNN